MKQEENFDEIIRQKFAEKEFVFNEESWEKAERKIDAARRLKKILLWSTVFITGFSCGIGVTFVFIQKKQTNDSIVLNSFSPKDRLSVTIENNINRNKNNTSNSACTTNNIHEPNGTGNNKKEDGFISDKNPNTSTLIETDKKYDGQTINSSGKEQEKGKERNTVILVRHQSHKGVTGEGKIRKMKNEQNLLIGESNNKNTYKNESGISELIGQKSEKLHKESIRREKKEVAETNKLNEKRGEHEEPINKAESDQSLLVKNPTVSDSDSENKNLNGEKSNDKTQIDISTSIQQLTGVLDVNKISDKVELSATEKIDSEKQAISSIAETQKDSTTYLLKDIVTTAVIKDSSSLKSDSAMTADQSNLSTSVLPGGLSSATFVSLVLGTNAELGWQYEETIEGRGFNPIAGIEINHYLNRKWMISSGIQYGSIAYLKASEKQFSKTTYGFGSVSVDTIINTTLLHYAVVPFLLEYNLNDKNAISIGGSVSYLVNTNSKVSTRSTSVSPMSGNTNTGEVKTISDMESGYYTNAFNKWDASISIGYRRRMTQRFTASALANWGLLDIKNNTFFSREKFERNSGIKLVISYTLFDL